MGIVCCRHIYDLLGYECQLQVRASLERVDPVGVAGRWSQHRCVLRRVYSVPYPNAVWHIDNNLRLVRWGFVVHGVIDGFSRLTVYLHCSLNNQAQTVAHHFLTAGATYGFPSRVRSDLGGENIDVAHFMLLNSTWTEPRKSYYWTFC